MCVVVGNEVHKLTFGAAEMKAITFAVKGKVAGGMVLTIYAPKVNPLTGDVIGVDKDAPKGKCKVDTIAGATGTATQTAAAAQPIEAGDLLLNPNGAIVGEVQ
jgi:hypothetical protein